MKRRQANRESHAGIRKFRAGKIGIGQNGKAQVCPGHNGAVQPCAAQVSTAQAGTWSDSLTQGGAAQVALCARPGGPEPIKIVLFERPRRSSDQERE
jgi:hypothetical protein